MELKETILRKVTISKKSQKKISDERYAHITKLELNNTSIHETEIFMGKMTKDRSQSRNQACVKVSEIVDSYQQDMNCNNIASDGGSNMDETIELAIDNVEVENEEAGVLLRSDDTSPKHNEELKELDNSITNVKKNKNISEKVETECTTVDKKIDIVDSDRKSQITDASKKFDKNVDSSETESDNSETYSKARRGVNVKIGSISSMENFKWPAISLNNRKPSQISPNQEKRKANKHDVEDGVTETSVKPKNDCLNNDGSNNKMFSDVLGIGGDIAQNESGFLKPHCSSIGVIRKYPSNLTEGPEERIQKFHNKNIQMGNREDLINNVKKCQSSVTLFENEIKGKETDSNTGSKSVIDLIAYFESLNTSKQSDKKFTNIKSKTTQSTSKKVQQNSKLKQDIQSNTKKSLFAQQYSKMNSKIVGKKKFGVKKPEITPIDVDAANKKRISESTLEDFSPTSHKGKRAAEIPPEKDFPDLITPVKIRRTEINSGESLTVKPNDTKRANKTTPELIRPEEDVNVIVVRKRPLEAVSKEILPSLNTRKSRYRMSLTTKSGTCAICKGKCVHIEQSLNRSKSNEVKIKEHLFIFPDEVHKKTKNSRLSSPRRFRTCFAPNNIKPMHQLFLPESEDSEKDSKIRFNSDTNKTRESENFLNHNQKQGTVNLSSTKNRLPFTQMSTKLQKSEKKHLSEQNKLKTPAKSPYPKRFFGTLLTVIVLAILYKGITGNFNLW